MPCSGRYAEAWSFASFWCVSALITGTHEGADNAGALTDSRVEFITRGVARNVGMVLYNLTDGSSGPVTDVSEHEIVATLTGGTDNDWDTGDSYRIVTIDALEIAAIEHYLDVTAPDISAALAAQNACDCPWAEWAAAYLAKLNIIDAAAFYTCSCGGPKTSDEQRVKLLDWMSEQLELLRTGKIDICAGAGGIEAPAWAEVERSVTDFAARRILSNSLARRRG